MAKSKKRGKKKTSAKGHVPLGILERRAKKLVGILIKRGGKVPHVRA